MSAAVSTDQAVTVSVACGRSVGLAVERPEIVADGYSVRVRLHPAAVVSRVVTRGSTLRGRPRDWLRREVDVVTHLAGSGVSVAPPWRDPGPHHVDGVDVSLWRWVEHDGTRVSDIGFGQSLGRLHAALATYDGDLPPLVGPLTDIASAMSLCDDDVLHRVAARLLPLASEWPRRPLHGDAHVGNVLMASAGPTWIDFEDVCTGPVEWDLASLTITDDAVAAYPGDVDHARLEDCRDLRRLQILAQLLVGGFDEPALRQELGRVS